jgi:mannose-6-phosphate isomerase
MTADRPDLPGARMAVSPDRLPARIDKPWGYEIWYAWTDRYAGKILHVRRGGRLSLQYHREKDESSYVLRGRLLLTWGLSEDRLEVTEIGEGYAWRNRPGEIHTIEALEDADVLEVSTPELDDVVRLRDSYGREGTRQP